MAKLVFILLCLPLFSCGQSLDSTLQPNARGEFVVDAVVEKIRSQCILVDDKYLMRRVAAVETDFGMNSKPDNGGIWKVNEFILNSTQASCQGNLRKVCNEILQGFAFDISTATMAHLDVPLISGLVMYAYITSLDIPVPASKSDQAEFWIKYIRPAGNKDDFIKKAVFKFGCSAAKMELVFAIDASGSVTMANFNRTLSFLQGVVRNLQIGPDMTRVAVINYATNARIAFNLDTYNSISNITDAISRIRYTDGTTSTSVVIDLARTHIFSKVRKNVPKVFVLITDGRSNYPNETIAAAENLKSDATTIFTIGIGRVNNYELTAVASSPACTYYYSLDSFNEIDAIIKEIQSESCAAPVTVEFVSTIVKTSVIENNPLPPDHSMKTHNVIIEPITNSVEECDHRNTAKVKVDVLCGRVEMYASHDFIKPGKAFRTYVAVATDRKPGLIRFPADKKLYLSLVSQREFDETTNCNNPHYNISFNTADKVEIICEENGEKRQCTKDDVKHLFDLECDDDKLPNPCSEENILKNKMRFKHPHLLNKYIQCTVLGEMEIVTCPTGTKYNEHQYVCGPKVIAPSTNSIPYTGANPCTREAIMRRQFYFAHPSENSFFIQCDEWQRAFLIQCPSNTIWSQQAYTCVHHSSIRLSLTNLCQLSQNEQPSYYVNPDDRRSFIKCDSSGNAFIIPCPLKTVWSQAKLECVKESIELGLCQKYDTESTPTSPNPSKKCSFGEYFPHKDPHKYYVCESTGLLTEMPCPSFLVWSQTLKLCNWPTVST